MLEFQGKKAQVEDLHKHDMRERLLVMHCLIGEWLNIKSFPENSTCRG